MRGWLACALLALLACERTTAPLPVSPIPEPDYAIYNVVLDSLFLGRVRSNQPPPRFIVVDTANLGEIPDQATFDWVAKQFWTHRREFDIAAAEFREASPIKKPLDSKKFRTQAPVTLVRRSEISHKGLGNPKDYWRAFYERYPGARGFIEFQKLSIHSTGRFALLDYTHACGWLCADYGYILLEKRDDQWIILKRVIYLMS